MGRNAVEMTGTVFGRLTVTCRAGSGSYRDGRKFATWKCVCECGSEVVVCGTELRKGHVRSCGCLRAELFRKNNPSIRIHGMWRSPIYAIWRAAKKRCSDPTYPEYKSYGGRGISMCPEWVASFQSFYEHIGPRPSPEYSLDRIDNDRGYEPGNVRWATREEQASNKRTNRIVEYDGERTTVTRLARRLGLEPYIVRNRMSQGWSVSDAVSRPVTRRKAGHR